MKRTVCAMRFDLIHFSCVLWKPFDTERGLDKPQTTLRMLPILELIVIPLPVFPQLSKIVDASLCKSWKESYSVLPK